jgi:hypothetical protein
MEIDAATKLAIALRSIDGTALADRISRPHFSQSRPSSHPRKPREACRSE